MKLIHFFLMVSLPHLSAFADPPLSLDPNTINGPNPQCEENNNSPAYCQNFGQQTCGGTSLEVDMAAQLERDELFYSQILTLVRPGQQPITDLVRNVPPEGRSMINLQNIELWLQDNPEIWRKAIRRTEEHVNAQANLSRQDLSSIIVEVRSSLTRAVQAIPHLTASAKAVLLSKITSMKLVNSKELHSALKALSQERSHKSRAEEAMNAFMSMCGPTGSQVNAITDKASFFYFCPGFLMDLKKKKDFSRQDIINSLTFTMAHELGHAFDTSEVYAPMKECFQATIGFEGYDQLNAADKEMLWENQHAEFTSDYWGQSTLRDKLQNLQLTGQAAADALKTSLKFLCSVDPGVRSDFTHPSSALRIEMISRHPDIRRMMGCPAPTKEAPFCSPYGRFPR